MARSECYFFSSAFGAAASGALLSSLAGASFTSPPQPQLFGASPQLLQPQSWFSTLASQPQLFCSQPQLLASQPQLCSQHEQHGSQHLWQQLKRPLRQPPQLPWPWNRWQPPQLPQLLHSTLQPPQLPQLPPKKAKALHGTANTATIKAIRGKFIPKSPFAYACLP